MRSEIKHLSHSSRETLDRCAKSWFLKYRTEAPRAQSLWLAGGSAVHETTEHYDLMSAVGNADAFQTGMVYERFFDLQLAKLREKEANEHKWRSSAGEDIERWRVMGLQFVQSYIDWREASPWELWTTPDGEPAIELDISGRLPGCEPEIKAYLDRVFWDPLFKRLWIVDLKTSKRPPKTAEQFGVYAALMAVKYGSSQHPDRGAAFMNRKGRLSTPFELESYTPKAVGAVFADAWKRVQSGVFPAEGIAKNDCFLCDVQSSCHAKGGPLAPLYDPDSPGHASNIPPF
ncbi:RecB family exonuclease [Streptomyces sp. t39]|uniref:RecB family exonuclease n=1 Tax=Streptomyces sp. t39 TaxID=1828156 RepID=UPI00165005FA|nr:PD-(D/E)XK nuclease family protein [Streptomyces sp. t39]